MELEGEVKEIIYKNELNSYCIAVFEIENIKINNDSNYNEFDSEFILNFIASLIATAQYPNKMEVGELIMSIPPYVLTDKATITELLDFFSLFIAQKKR